MTIAYSPVDDETFARLAIIADQMSAPSVSRGDLLRFLAACEADAHNHDGIVSSQRVREALVLDGDPLIEAPRRLSCLWTISTGKGRPMRRLKRYEQSTDRKSRNSAKRMPLRKWIGGTR